MLSAEGLIGTMSYPLECRKEGTHWAALPIFLGQFFLFYLILFLNLKTS